MFHILIGRVQPLLDANFPSAANLHPVIIFASSCFLCSSISVQPLVRCNANEELCVPTMPYHNADESVTDALSAKAESAALFL